MSMISSILILLLSYLFLTAALAKIKDLDHFQQSLQDYQLLPAGLLKPASYSLPIIELILGLAVLVPAAFIPEASSLAALGMALLLGLYAFAIAINLLRGRKYLDCGCNGPNKRQPISWLLVARNLGLVLLTVLLAINSASLVNDVMGWAMALLASCFAIAAYYSFEQLLSNHRQLVQRHSSAANSSSHSHSGPVA